MLTDTGSSHPSVTTVSETIEIRAPAEAVFAHVDDIRNLGWHMTSQSSMAMMGSRLKLEILSDRSTGPGATYRYSGTMMGLPIDFSEAVTKYAPPSEKVWRTIGEPQLLIIASYEMRVAVERLSQSSARLTSSIGYELPRSAFWRIVGLLLARPYSRWCLRRMLRDSRRALEARRG
jgi:Polyketide cyclase / dehydrase and lipid transport